MRDDRSGLASAKTQGAEQSLALAHTQLNVVSLPEVMREEFAIPQILRVPQVARGCAQVPIDPLPSDLIQTPWSSRSLALVQPAEAFGFKSLDPTFDRRRMLPQPVGNLVTAIALSHQEHPMKSVVIARLFRTVNLVLQGQGHCGDVSDLEAFHAPHATKTRRG